MRRTLLKSKIHRAVLTGADLHYEGSIQVDADLMTDADLVPFELVQVLNVASGARLETYVIEGERGSGAISLNGPAARLGCVGDLVIIASYADYEAEEAADHAPTIVLVDAKNRPVGPRLSSGNAR
jgi:aspartate 1-decarboxylase